MLIVPNQFRFMLSCIPPLGCVVVYDRLHPKPSIIAHLLLHFVSPTSFNHLGCHNHFIIRSYSRFCLHLFHFLFLMLLSLHISYVACIIYSLFFFLRCILSLEIFSTGYVCSHKFRNIMILYT